MSCQENKDSAENKTEIKWKPGGNNSNVHEQWMDKTKRGLYIQQNIIQL